MPQAGRPRTATHTDGTASRSSYGTVGNTRTRNSTSWNNGNLTADRDGNIYNYDRTYGTQRYNSYTGGWDSAYRPTTSYYGNNYPYYRNNYASDYERYNSAEWRWVPSVTTITAMAAAAAGAGIAMTGAVGEGEFSRGATGY